MNYLDNDGSNLSYFRSIILFGRNVASYKFALGKSLLELDLRKKDFVSLEELAIPYSKHLIEHIKTGKRQTTSNSSKFIYACKLYSEGKISEDEIINITKQNGFNNVLDAFHNVTNYQGDDKFFEKNIRNGVKGISLTDDLYSLQNNKQVNNINLEIEGRWNLVENSWEERNPKMIIEYDVELEELFTSKEISNESYLNSHLRISVADARNPLSGYQKGKCFYCYTDISAEKGRIDTADVDHFFPISLQYKFSNINLNLNGIWNLVLSCQECNRGIEHAKWAHTPSVKLLDRLERRNNYYIASKHPLGDTIMRQTGSTIQARRKFLMNRFKLAKEKSSYEWYPKNIKGIRF